MTEPEPIQQVDRTYVRYRGRKLVYFSGCDYFRMASHPRVIAALQSGVKKYGLNVAASRLTTGNHLLYHQLEAELKKFFAAEAALLVSSGYATNLVVAQALAGHFSHALLDERAHPSPADAARFLDCPVLRFKSRDPEALARAVKRCGPGARIVLFTDGMFSGNGSAAPLAEYLKVLPKDALIVVDDAHGAGVLGRTGRGALEQAGVSRRRIVQCITLSKAFGTYGGAVLCSNALRKSMIDRSNMFVGSTALPLPLTSAALEGIRILKTDRSLRRRLHDNAAYFKTALRQAGMPIEDQPGPIVPLLPKTRGQALDLKNALLAAGIFPPFLRYPGGPPAGYFRFVISSEHTHAQLDRVLRVLRQFVPAS